MTYDAVLFDHDGVLTTPTDRDVLRRAARSAFEAFDVDSPPEAYVEDLIAGVDPEWLERVCAEFDLDPEAFWRRRDEAAARVQRGEVRAGRKRQYDDVAALASLSVPLGIVSSNQHETIEFVLEWFDWPAFFDTYYGREPTVRSLDRKKPATYYLDRALSDLDVTDALFVGDSTSDVVAADAAGLDSALLVREGAEAPTPPLDPTYRVATLHDLVDIVGDAAGTSD